MMGRFERKRRAGATLAWLCVGLLWAVGCGDAEESGDEETANNASANNASANNATANNAATNNATTNNAATNNATANNADPGEALEVEGAYDDGLGGGLVIEGDQWIVEYPGEDGSVLQVPSTIISFDNDANGLIVQSPPDDAFTPNQFARQVWTEPDAEGAFYYCTVVFGLETLEAAEADTTEADASDPAQRGCGGFPWTQLTPR
jgi:hypothetical protein